MFKLLIYLCFYLLNQSDTWISIAYGVLVCKHFVNMYLISVSRSLAVC